jgi:hypothetical protein
MKKLLVLTLFALLILTLPTIIAIDVSVDKLNNSEDVIIKGLDQPAKVILNVTNNENTDKFLFFNLLGFVMEPKDPVSIGGGMTKIVELTIYPRKDLDVKNYYALQYFIRAQSDETEQEEQLTIKMVELASAFEIGSEDIDPDSNSVTIYIHNKERFDFKDLNVRFTSQFFELTDDLSLGPNEKEEFIIELDKEDFKKLTAGFYTFTAQIEVEDLEAEIEGTIKFIEKNIVETTEKKFGIIVSTNIIRKTNEGNTVEGSDTVIKKNIISRLFTSFNPDPDIVERKGLSVYYTWNQKINPGDTLEIVVKTNWLYPLLIILLIVVIVILVKQYVTTDVQVRKRVSFVKAKGGEFALKVTLNVYSTKYVERVNIVDRLPALMKVYERFGGEKPSRVNQKARLIEWDFEKLEAGELRTLSYIIYSKKVGVMGKFALPSATAIYQRLGKIKESTSNKAFFMAEQKTGHDVEYY